MKPFWPLLATVMSILMISILSQAEVLYRGFYKDHNVEAFYERPSIESFAKLDPEHQRMAMADMLSTPKAPASPEQKVLNHFLPRLDAEGRSEVSYYAFRLAVENGQAELAKKFFSQATKSNTKLAQEYICIVLNETGAPVPGDEFDEELFANSSERIQQLLPLIAENTNPSAQTCEIEVGGESAETRLVRKVSISELVSKASPDFKMQLESLVREHSLTGLRKNKAASADLIQSFAACTEPQIINFFNSQIYPTFSQMPKGGPQYVLYKNENCLINGIMKKIVVKNDISYEFTPSNGKFGYRKDSFSFRSGEELASLLKTGRTTPK